MVEKLDRLGRSLHHLVDHIILSPIAEDRSAGVGSKECVAYGCGVVQGLGMASMTARYSPA